MIGNPFQERVRVAGANTDRDPSAEIWRHFKPQRMNLNFDDFRTFGGAASTYTGEAGIWRSYQDTGATVAPLATEVNGVLQLDTSATDNDICAIQLGSTTSVQTQISRGVTTAGTDKEVLFEARIRVGQVSDNYNLFVGLMEENSIADSFFVDSGGAVIDKDYVGFVVNEGDGDALDIEYKKSGETAQNTSAVKALAASTWYKVGILYLPNAPTDEKVRFYIDGEQASDADISLTNMAASTFPDEEEMGVVIGIGAAAATAMTVDIDWVAVAQAF